MNNDNDQNEYLSFQNLFEIKVGKFLTPLENLIRKQTTASILLFSAVLIAITFANSPWNFLILSLSELETGLIFHEWSFVLPLKEWVGSGLMALFFFLIGLELKREILAGKLKDPKQINIVVSAALGGMIVPALLYWGVNYGGAGEHGWAIPMATDTAFSIGILALLAKRSSYGVAIFLAAMAIFDDIGAILVIAFFYAHDLNLNALLFSLLILSILFLVNAAGVRNGWVYACLGFLLWICIYHSGIHATLAGLLMAMTVPARTRLGENKFIEKIRHLLLDFEKGEGRGVLGSTAQHSLTVDIGDAVKEGSTPLQRWENSLIYPIGIIVLPLFALLHAGVSLTATEIITAFSSQVTQGIMVGLVIGKPLGILLFVWIGLKLNIGKLPKGVLFLDLVGIGLLAGIGFTMSLFITMLSFAHHPVLVQDAKIGILFASLASAILACAWIYMSYEILRKSKARIMDTYKPSL